MDLWRVEWLRHIGFGCGLTIFSGPTDFAAAWRECKRVLREETERVSGARVTMILDALPTFRLPRVIEID